LNQERNSELGSDRVSPGAVDKNRAEVVGINENGTVLFDELGEVLNGILSFDPIA
jgi:hypothetical protein